MDFVENCVWFSTTRDVRIIMSPKKNVASKRNSKAKISAKSAVRKKTAKSDPVAALSKAHQVALKVVEKLRKTLDAAILKEEKIAARLNVAVTKAEAKAQKSIAKASKVAG